MTIIKDFRYDKNNLPKDLPFLDMGDVFLLPSYERIINIKEPKHIKLIDYALGIEDRLIAIAPMQKKKVISDIGCAGRLVSFKELPDSSYKVVLRGICRFYLDKIYQIEDGFFKLSPIWSDFIEDIDLFTQKIENRGDLNNIADNYFSIFGNNIREEEISSIPDNKILQLLISNVDIGRDAQLAIERAKNINDLSLIIRNQMEIRLAQYEGRLTLKH